MKTIIARGVAAAALAAAVVVPLAGVAQAAPRQDRCDQDENCGWNHHNHHDHDHDHSLLGLGLHLL